MLSNMLNGLKQVISYMAFIPVLIEIVTSIIKVVEVEGFGEDKKKVVMETVELMYNTITKYVVIPIPLDYVKSFADSFVDMLVHLFNITGFFTTTKEEST